MRCGSCQNENPDNAAFCGRCGHVLGWDCTNCSRINFSDSIFCVGCGEQRTDDAAHKPPDERTSHAELRQITFMYVDVVDSTALSDALDPEAYSDAIVRYRKTVAGPILAGGGLIGNLAGDGVFAYFGYPRAASNDAARAVQAALDIGKAITEADSDMLHGVRGVIAVRIGIHTGLSVIGRFLAMGSDSDVLGKAANVAARVLLAAEPGQIVISDSTFRLVEPHFVTRPLGPVVPKGLTEPISLYEVQSPTNLSRGLRRPLRRNAPIRGRELETMVLRERWRRAGSRGSATLICGAPGIGKSRLVHDFLATTIIKAGGRVLEVECLEPRTHSALQPFRELLIGTLGDMTGASSADIEARLDRGCDLSAEHKASLRHFVTGTTDPSVSPVKRREDLAGALVAWIEAQQRDGPVALLVEDLHWADDSTLMLLERIISSVESTKLLVLLTAREEFTHSLARKSRLNRIELTPLDRQDAEGLLRDFAVERLMPKAVVDMILQRASGVPLFIEELARAWLDKRKARDQPVEESPDVPPSLRDALMERLDRLGQAKGLAQLAAVLGQTFSAALLEATEGGDPERTRRDVAMLVEASILRPRRVGADAEYEFHHALVREVAHDSLLPRRRTECHQRIANVIQSIFPEIADRRPEVLAWHLEHASRPSEAIDAWLNAGRQAAVQSANVEALAHLTRAMALLRAAPESPARQERMLDVLLAMGGPLIAMHGWAAIPVDEVYREAIKICRSIGDQRKLFDVLRGRQNVLLLRGELSRCRSISLQLLSMAEQSGDTQQFLEARRGLGVCAFLAGRFDEAIVELDRALDLFEPTAHDRLATVYGVNPGVVAASWRAWASCFIGDTHRAVGDIERALRMAHTAKHPFSIGYALCFAASIHQTSGDVANARKYADLAIHLANDRGYPYWHAWAGIVRGWTTGMQGPPNQGIVELTAALAEYQASGAKMIVGYAHALAAELALRDHAMELAHKHLEAAASAARATEMRFCDQLITRSKRTLEASDPCLRS
jgi:class 3 adenylate cyclase/tetratricopeptide (TPR) repeat protein